MPEIHPLDKSAQNALEFFKLNLVIYLLERDWGG